MTYLSRTCSTMMKVQLLIFCAIVLGFCIYSGFAIQCYICNSFDDPGCSDFFNNASYSVHPCPDKTKYCRKIIQETYYEGQWHMRFVRQCAKEGELDANRPNQDWNCFDKIGTYRVKVKYCHCRVDGCNTGSSNMKYNQLTLTFAIVLWTVTKL